jgi:hypothetical protein
MILLYRSIGYAHEQIIEANSPPISAQHWRAYRWPGTVVCGRLPDGAGA